MSADQTTEVLKHKQSEEIKEQKVMRGPKKEQLICVKIF